MAQLVYVDETGSSGTKGSAGQPYLTLAAVLVDEAKVAQLDAAVQEVAWKHLGWLPADFELHGLNVSLLAAGVDGAEAGQGIVELEVLSPNDAQIYLVPLSDGALVSECQRIVGEIARTWAADLEFPPRPSGACASRDAHGWCDPPPVAPAARPHVDDDEFAGFAEPF